MSDRRSKAITEGDIRAPNRSMLRAVGFDDAAFQKPIVGVANAYSNLTPCNAGIATLSDRAMGALRETSEYFMPSVPIEMPSATVMVPKTCGITPDSRSAPIARSESVAMPALHGVRLL